VLKYGTQPVNETVDVFLPSVLRISGGEGGDGLFGSGCTRWMRTFGDLDSRRLRYERLC
jgi:hypothetical protein